MERTGFARILGQAFDEVAQEHGRHYPQGGADAWGEVGAAYLGFALCGLTSARLRSLQYDARELYGSVILDCKWYDSLVSKCLNAQEPVTAYVTGPDDQLCPCKLDRNLFLEMLDFCREG
jgi:hypothetical protein